MGVVAVAGAIAWAYPRLRGGARAWTAIVCGVLAIVAGVVDGLRHVLIDRPAGDDLTTLIAGVAGIGLVIDGVLRLWRGRRRDGHVVLRRLGTGVVAATAGFFVLLPVCIALIATHVSRAPEPVSFGRAVALRTHDGLRLAAGYAPSANGAAVIVFPGHQASTLARARLLNRHGYGVLVLDRRGEGQSEGRLNLFGSNGEGDVRAALDFLSARADVERGRIAGLGLSVGGELMLQTAAHDPRLRAVVSEGAGVRSLREHRHTPGLGAVQRWVTPWLVETTAVAVLSDTLPPPDLVDTVKGIGPRPVLLIRGAEGHEDEALNAVYAERIGPSATSWTAPGGHTAALASAPAEYERRVIGFFDGALRLSRRS
jgi:fermentation-respiration switch protein FrsA (DUF1100 family)